MPNVFIREIRNFFSHSNALTKLIIVNVAVFILYNILDKSFYLFNADPMVPERVIKWLGVPAGLSNLMHQPWSIFTYMFLHQEFFHIFFNMIWLYWMGVIFTEYLGGKKLTITYIFGGLSGALLYILAFNVFPVFSSKVDIAYAIGASAGVMAVTVGIATLAPGYRVQLFLFGSVPLKYIALFYVLLDFVSINKGNAGGHITHLGGALYGFLFIRQLQKGRDFSSGIGSFFNRFTSIFEKKKMKVYYNSDGRRQRAISDDEYAMQKKEKQEIIDGILDKISQSGYESLTKKEKEILFRMSKDDTP